MATPNDKNFRTLWSIVILLIGVGIFCLGFSIFSQAFSAPYEGEYVSVPIGSDEQADYSAEIKPPRPPVSIEVVIDVLRDLLPSGTDIAARVAAFRDQLLTPVPMVTPAPGADAAGIQQGEQSADGPAAGESAPLDETTTEDTSQEDAHAGEDQPPASDSATDEEDESSIPQYVPPAPTATTKPEDEDEDEAPPPAPPPPPTNTPTPTPTPVADLAVTKDDGVAQYTPGGMVTYTIVVTNNGPDDVSGAQVGDNKPAQVSSWTWTCSHAGGASGCDGVTNSTADFSDTVDLPNGSSITYTVTANISSGASGNLVNTVSVAPPAGTSDPTPGNDSATDTDTANPQADLSVTKDDGVTEYTPGGTVMYTIVVSNNGSSDAAGAQVSDSKPAQVSSWTWTCNHAGGASGCDGVTNSTADFSDTVDLPNGSSITYTVTANISSGASGNLDNTVSVGPPAGTTDPTPGNDSATDTDTQSSCSNPDPTTGFVSSITPADGSTGVPVTVNPVIRFNQAMDASTLTYGDKDYIALCSNNGCGQIVSASVTISTTTYTNDTVTIAPDANLNASTDYWISVGVAVKNACSTAQGITVQTQFTTQ
ncbi:MAG: DUF11 domain-containing protein [Anaerolineales bacterium]|nr:DUF11 domain-containing protein [Anaerolineales bacterium]